MPHNAPGTSQPPSPKTPPRSCPPTCPDSPATRPPPRCCGPSPPSPTPHRPTRTSKGFPPDPADADLQAPADAHTTPPRADLGELAHPWSLVPHGDEPADPEHLPPDPQQAEQDAILDQWRADDEDAARQRIYQTLTAAHTFFTQRAETSWVPGYLATRGLPTDAAGYAPAGWTTLTDHLREAGYTDTDLKAAGLAKTSARGTLIDVFRDRAVLPIHTPDGQVAAFIGRKPETNHDPAVPKYLNSPGTAVFTKSDLPYGLNPDTVAALIAGADLAIAEGPMDALAINTAAAAAGRNLVAVAPNGTALTAGQLATLNHIAPLADRQVIVAMDTDPAGLAAAARAYPLLLAAGVTDPQAITEWDGKDPAQTLVDHGPAHLAELLDRPRALADVAVDDIVARWPIHDGTPESRVNALHEAAPLVAAMPLHQQIRQTQRLTETLDLNAFNVADTILAAGEHLPSHPRPPHHRSSRPAHAADTQHQRRRGRPRARRSRSCQPDRHRDPTRTRATLASPIQRSPRDPRRPALADPRRPTRPPRRRRARHPGPHPTKPCPPPTRPGRIPHATSTTHRRHRLRPDPPPSAHHLCPRPTSTPAGPSVPVRRPAPPR